MQYTIFKNLSITTHIASNLHCVLNNLKTKSMPIFVEDFKIIKYVFHVLFRLTVLSMYQFCTAIGIVYLIF